MEYSEFRERIERLGYQVDNHSSRLNVYVETNDGETIVSISKLKTYVINTDYHKFRNLHNYAKDTLFDLVSLLSKTPPEERGKVGEYTTDIFDYGVCHFCGQPINQERPIFIRKNDAHETLVVHKECFHEKMKERAIGE